MTFERFVNYYVATRPIAAAIYREDPERLRTLLGEVWTGRDREPIPEPFLRAFEGGDRA